MSENVIINGKAVKHELKYLDFEVMFVYNKKVYIYYKQPFCHISTCTL